MPKRIGHLYERFATEENFIRAEYLIGKNKPDNKMARHIMHNKERYGKQLFERYISGEFQFHESRQTTIRDSYKGKERHLKIPCLEDQAIQQAWLNIAIPYIEKRNYYYNCGSIPNAGQTRACEYIKRCLRNPKMKYACVTDIRKFYDTCPHELVIKGLERIFKDKRFVGVAKDILHNMSGNGIGLAIGYPTSHWFANVALLFFDLELKSRFPKVKMTRFMDDVAMMCTNKRLLKRCVQWYREKIVSAKLRLKKWCSFRVSDRGISFLSYRFFHRKTVMVKPLMFRLSRRFKRTSAKMNVHAARAVLSYLGILKHCDSFNFRQKYLYPFINPKRCRRLISNYDKNILRRAATAA